MCFSFQAYGQPAAYGQNTTAPPPMEGYNNEQAAYFPFGHPSRQASSSGPGKRKKEVGCCYSKSLILYIISYTVVHSLFLLGNE